jgi:hypothetical protein
MKPEADLSLAGQARLLAEFVETLDLQDATLVFNDWAAPQILVAEALTARISGMILVACETAGNYPPGLPGKNLALLGAIPGALRFALAAMRLPVIRRTPVTLGGWPSMRCQMISSGSGCAGRGATRRSFEMLGATSAVPGMAGAGWSRQRPSWGVSAAP